MSTPEPDPALEAVVARLRRTDPFWSTSTVLDLGGGSGRSAVPLATEGASVTVVDRSADALATLASRARAAGVSAQVRGLQADLEDVVAGAVDGLDVAAHAIVMCHDLLTATTDPAGTLRALAGLIGPGRTLSVVVANPRSTVVGRALAGLPGAALEQVRGGAGAALDLDSTADLLEHAGLRVHVRRGLGIFTGRVAEHVLDRTPGARSDLAELDRELADDPAYRVLAARLQVVADRPSHAGAARGT